MVIKLTKKPLTGPSYPVYVNTSNIHYYYREPTSTRTYIEMDANELRVAETPEEITEMLLGIIPGALRYERWSNKENDKEE